MPPKYNFFEKEKEKRKGKWTLQSVFGLDKEGSKYITLKELKAYHERMKKNPVFKDKVMTIRAVTKPGEVKTIKNMNSENITYGNQYQEQDWMDEKYDPQFRHFTEVEFVFYDEL
ncbi:MAG: hypothetical protein EOP00_29255 [Pedobacter sp.]|nr:MAG: hypothetical protein EOP00_29255 [Pedobacter sp.]